MARSIAGSQFLAYSIGQLATVSTVQIMAIVKAPADGTLLNIVRFFNAGFTAGAEFNRKADNKLELIINYTNFSASPTITVTVADGWCFVACFKVNDTTGPWFLKRALGPGGTLAAEQAAGFTGGVTTGQVTSCDHFGPTMDLHGVAIYDYAFGGPTIEYMIAGYRFWRAFNPKAFWIHDQASSSDKVSDLSGNGSNESSRSGTTLSTAQPQTMQYGTREVIEVHREAPPSSYRIQPPAMV